MPNIEQLDAKGAPEAVNTGVEAAVQSGRRVGMFYHQIGEDLGGAVQKVGEDYQKQVFREEVSKGTATLAQIQSQKLQEWNEKSAAQATSLDGLNDTKFAQRYLDESVKPSLDAWANSFQTPQGKMWALEQAKDAYGRLWDKAVSGQAELTGAAAVANLNATTQGHAESAFHDPEHTADYVALYAADLASAVKAHPGLDDTHVAAMQAHTTEAQLGIAMSGVEGAIADKDFDGARKLLADPKLRGVYGDRVGELGEKIDAAEQRQQERTVTDAENAVKLDDLKAAPIAAALGVEAIQQRAQGLGISADLQTRIEEQVRLHPHSEQLRQLLDSIPESQRQANSGETIPTNTTVSTNLDDGILNGTVTERDIIAASSGAHPQIAPDVAQRKIERLRLLNDNPALKENETKLNENLATAIRPFLVTGGGAGGYDPTSGTVTMPGKGDPAGEAIWAIAKEQIQSNYEKAARTTDPAEVVRRMADPTSPGYIGSGSALLKSYQYAKQLEAAHPGAGVAWLQQHPNSASWNPTPPTAATPTTEVKGRLPSETIADWRRRTGG
jgi:hypothetical protein